MINTLVITNFSGRLTRIINGDLNSGFAKFSTSFGYDPFSKPMNLTWLETPTSIVGLNNTVLALAGKVLPASVAGANVHILAQSGNWYQIRSSSSSDPNLNSVIGVTTNLTTAGVDLDSSNLRYGASMEFFGSITGADLEGNSLGKLFVAGDSRIVSINPDATGAAQVGNTSLISGSVIGGGGIYHPLKSFAGNLIFGNGPTIGKIDNTGKIVSSTLSVGTGNIYSELNPALGTQAKVTDMEVSTSNDYITLATSGFTRGERLDVPAYDATFSIPSSDGKLFQWNGTDLTVTAATSVPTYLVSALETYFKTTAFFAADTFGTAFNTGTGKILSLPNNTSPSPNAVTVNGNFITWACAETDATKRYMSLYYYGSLDQENPTGLYRLLRWTTVQANGFVSKVPLNLLVSNKYVTILSAPTALTTMGYGKHYIAVSSANSTGTLTHLLSFLITPTGTGTPQSGVYETQTQLFSKRVGISQIRVYIEPAVSGNAFTLDMIGSDGSIITNGTYTYTFGDITDPLSGSSAVERINFNTNARTQYALGLRITNTGTVNMTFKKIEVDYSEEGR